MKASPITKYALLELMANFLAHAYKLNKFERSTLEFLLQVESNWIEVVRLAQANRVWTNIVAILAENFDSFPGLTPSTRKTIALAYLRNVASAKIDKKQLLELNQQLEVNGQRVILIKGATRFFDGMYPSAAHRYMSDLDIFIEHHDALEAFLALGYETTKYATWQIQDFSPEFLERHSVRHHHLPQITKENYSKNIELHQSFVHKFVDYELRSEAIELATVVNGTTRLLQLDPADQFILHFLHSRIVDNYTSFGTSRLRNFLEGYLLHQKLTPAQLAIVDEYFDSRKLTYKLDSWKYIVYRYFGVEEFKQVESTTMRAKFTLHRYVSSHPILLSTKFLFYSLYNLFTVRLFDSLERNYIFNRLGRAGAWKLFLKRILPF